MAMWLFVFDFPPVFTISLSGSPGAQADTPSDGIDQWTALRAGLPGSRTEMVYNINTALRFTAAIR